MLAGESTSLCEEAGQSARVSVRALIEDVSARDCCYRHSGDRDQLPVHSVSLQCDESRGEAPCSRTCQRVPEPVVPAHESALAFVSDAIAPFEASAVMASIGAISRACAASIDRAERMAQAPE